MIPIASIALLAVGLAMLYLYVKPVEDPKGSYISKEALMNIRRQSGRMGDEPVSVGARIDGRDV